MIQEIHKEIELITSYLSKEEKNKVRHALKLSEEAHSNQLRKSGDPFITHPLEVAKILTSIKLDADSIVAGLLHDTLEDTNLKIDEINKYFGNEIVELVDGLTKINRCDYDNAFHDYDSDGNINDKKYDSEDEQNPVVRDCKKYLNEPSYTYYCSEKCVEKTIQLQNENLAFLETIK